VASGYCANGLNIEGTQCSSGYHVERAVQGPCCADDSGAMGVFGGLSAIAVAALAAAAVLLH